MSPHPHVTAVLIRTRDEDTDTQTDDHMRTQGGDGVHTPQTEAPGGTSLATPASWMSGLQNCGRIRFCLSFCERANSSPGSFGRAAPGNPHGRGAVLHSTATPSLVFSASCPNLPFLKDSDQS